MTANPTEVQRDGSWRWTRSFGDRLRSHLHQPSREESFLLAAKFQNSELIPKALTVNHIRLHDAVHSSEAETWTVQTRAALGGVKHGQIFPGAQPAAAVSSDGLAQVQRFGKKKKKKKRFL